MLILAVDPGPEESAYVLWDGEKLHTWHKGPNEGYLTPGFVNSFPSHTMLIIEKVACYGMPVGAEVFDTVYFSGKLAYAFKDHFVDRIERKAVKMHLCGTMRAKDSNIIQALKDRFGDKGTKRNPGFFYGFSKDIWQAFALAVTCYDQETFVDDYRHEHQA